MDFAKLSPDEINALVAERVMGWKQNRDHVWHGKDSCGRRVYEWHPMTSPADACEVWDKLVADGGRVRLVNAGRLAAVIVEEIEPGVSVNSCKGTWAAAICYAAIEAAERSKTHAEALLAGVEAVIKEK
jgi:hypothetical protein